MTEMTMTQAAEKLYEVIKDANIVDVKIDDGAHLWDVHTLVDEMWQHDDGAIHDLAVSEDGIARLRPDGVMESTLLYRVVPRPTCITVDLNIIERAIAHNEEREAWQRAAGNTSAEQYYRGIAEALLQVRNGSFEPDPL